MLVAPKETSMRSALLIVSLPFQSRLRPQAPTWEAIDAHKPRFHDLSLENITATGARHAIIIGIPSRQSAT